MSVTLVLFSDVSQFGDVPKVNENSEVDEYYDVSKVRQVNEVGELFGAG